MQEIVETLKRNAQEVRFGTASVELLIHDGAVVKTTYRTTQTKVDHSAKKQTEDTDE